jgi:hypothetical protein
MVRDVAYWLNQKLAAADRAGFAINASVEEGTVTARVGGYYAGCRSTCVLSPMRYAAGRCAAERLVRSPGKLFPQDEFIAESLQPQDTLVISVGGNDIALAPSYGTMAATALLMLTPECLLGCANPVVWYFKWLMKVRVCTGAFVCLCVCVGLAIHVLIGRWSMCVEVGTVCSVCVIHMCVVALMSCVVAPFHRRHPALARVLSPWIELLRVHLVSTSQPALSG